VKYDAVANDVPQYFTVQGYPTIYLLTSQDKTSPILFNAPRKHSTLLKFVAEKATNQLKSFNREGFSQAYLDRDGAPRYSDKEERLKKNKADGFKKQRREAQLARDEL